jgi:mono/diheme cytochrome c family protein
VLFIISAVAQGTKSRAEAPPLTAEEQKLLSTGKDIYEVTCLSCHQANGMGLESLAPPLVGSDWVTNSVERLVRITLHGMRGPAKINGRVYQFEVEMPPLAVLSDDQLAAVLTYVRREWGHTASSVTSNNIASIRAATADREQPWTEAELLRIR